jgi:putative flippase GtrA
MDRAVETVFQFWQRFTFTRYLAASIIALAFDVASFSSLVAMGIGATAASATGYSIGIVIHWMVSAHYVFPGKTRDGGALQWQRVLFAGSALLGLAITVTTVTFLSNLGVHAITAKGAAVAISFIAVYAARKWGVFR